MPHQTVPAAPTGIDVIAAARQQLDTRYEVTEYDLRRLLWNGAVSVFPGTGTKRLAILVAETIDMIDEYVWLTTHHSLTELAADSPAGYGAYLAVVLDEAVRHYRDELNPCTTNGAPRRTPRHTKVQRPNTTSA